LLTGNHFQAYFKAESLSPQGQGPWYRVSPTVSLTDGVFNPQLEKWKNSKYDDPDDLSTFSQKFDEGVKRVFSNDKISHHVKFGSARDNDPQCGIKAGRFTLTG